MANILYLYNATQTYTDTVYQHISALGKYSRHRAFFCHHDAWTDLHADLSRFDAVVIHYSVRLPFDQFSPSGVEALKRFTGLKVVMIQDEYDHTHRAWHWIKTLGVRLVFTVVPPANVGRVYPPEVFPGVRFVSVLTGYVPENIPHLERLVPPSSRPRLIGYRGRPLPLRYGTLGQEKVGIGAMVKAWCEARQIPCDIAWSEEARIYGPRWFDFIGECRAMLGSESGSNVFDWHGDLDQRIKHHREAHPQADDDEIFQAVVRPLEIDGLMNQISPRVFEAITLRTALVLFEGQYSGVLEPDRHYISLKKDGSNLDEVFTRLQDGAFVDALTARAHAHVIESGRYRYEAFVERVDGALDEALAEHGPACARLSPQLAHPTLITTLPIRAEPPRPVATGVCDVMSMATGPRDFLRLVASLAWRKLPQPLRQWLRPGVKLILFRR